MCLIIRSYVRFHNFCRSISIYVDCANQLLVTSMSILIPEEKYKIRAAWGFYRLVNRLQSMHVALKSYLTQNYLKNHTPENVWRNTGMQCISYSSVLKTQLEMFSKKKKRKRKTPGLRAFLKFLLFCFRKWDLANKNYRKHFSLGISFF